MSDLVSDLKRMASSSGLYALGEVLNRGLAFLLLPIYTRFLPQAEYGALGLFNAFSGVLFACLLLGMPSALTKVFHRDCDDEPQRSRVLVTALFIDLPILLVGGAVLFLFAEPVGRLIIGQDGTALWVRLVVATAISASLVAIVLSSFRARERAMAFLAINFLQFVPAMGLNILLVVHYGMGIEGVLWGNLISSILSLPVGLWLASREDVWRFDRRLVKPLVHFGVLLIPVTLASWVIDLSDRYVLRLYSDLEQIAIYDVGYKIGMILQMAVVWPFQLAWPAVSFSISKRPGHEVSYAKVLTYLSVVLCIGFLGLSLASRAGLSVLAGESYAAAVQVVPWVALAYVFNGVHFCLTPGIHVAKKTKYLPLFSGAAAVLNLGLNFLIVPHYGILGAAWTTTATFFFLAVATWILSQRVYPVPHEVGRLVKITVAVLATWFGATAFEPAALIPALVWHTLCAAVGFPLLLMAMGFLDKDEWTLLRRLPTLLRTRLEKRGGDTAGSGGES